jgi:hypothetical protein
VSAVIRLPINLSAAGQLEHPCEVNNSIKTLEEVEVCKVVSLLATAAFPDELAQDQQAKRIADMNRKRSIIKYAVFWRQRIKLIHFFL